MTDKREEQRKTATWPRIGVSEIRSGFGWAYKDEPGTDTITNVLDKVEADFAALEAKIDAISRLSESVIAALESKLAIERDA